MPDPYTTVTEVQQNRASPVGRFSNGSGGSAYLAWPPPTVSAIACLLLGDTKVHGAVKVFLVSVR